MAWSREVAAYISNVSFVAVPRGGVGEGRPPSCLRCAGARSRIVVAASGEGRGV